MLDLAETLQAHLQAVELQLWQHVPIHTPRFRHNTSNILESFNFILKTGHKLYTVEVLDQIWHCNMQSRCDQLHKAE